MVVPFIKLFNTPNSAYFLDVNKNEIIPISEEAHNYLNEVMSGRQAWDALRLPELADLQDQGYLTTESNVVKILHNNTKYLETYLNRNLSKLTLQLTQSCNLRCKYCVYSETVNDRQRRHSTKSMDWNTAKKAIDFLWARSIDSNELYLSYYGGEPFLEFELIKQCVEYSKKLFSGKQIYFNITTNGTLLTDEHIYYSEKNDISLMISLDGPKEIHDRNRVFENGSGTYDTVIETIERIKKIAPKCVEKLYISMVVNPEEDFDCVNSVFFDGDELDQVKLQHSMVDFGYDNIEITSSEEYRWKSEYQNFIALLAYYNRYPEDEVSPLALNILRIDVNDYNKIEQMEKLHETDAPSGPCVPGHSRLLVDVEGRLFPCERAGERNIAAYAHRVYRSRVRYGKRQQFFKRWPDIGKGMPGLLVF